MKNYSKNPTKNAHARPDAVKGFDNNIQLKSRFWLEKDNEIFLASGRVELLELLDKEGSLTNAAEAMNISYHHAWNMVEKINSLAGEPIIIKSQGGKGGGSSKLSPKGKDLIRKYKKLKKVFQDLINEINFSFKDDGD